MIYNKRKHPHYNIEYYNYLHGRPNINGTGYMNSGNSMELNFNGGLYSTSFTGSNELVRHAYEFFGNVPVNAAFGEEVPPGHWVYDGMFYDDEGSSLAGFIDGVITSLLQRKIIMNYF